MDVEKMEQLRHSAAHLLAHAISELFPTTLFTIGPATEQGFFYDFLATPTLKEDDLFVIEARMYDIATRNLPITHEFVSKEKARELFKNNKFKLELIDNLEESLVGISRQGDFYDLCRGGHVGSTGELKHFRLLNISGVYWRGDKNNPQLQRVSGVVFATAQELAAFEKQREEALKYDHRKIGKELDLFSFQAEGTGFPFFHPKGMVVINELKAFMRGLLAQYGYHEIATPIVLNESLWKTSGHAYHYRENMYFLTIEDTSYAIKPMNCPGAFLVYKNRPHSYRELPMRLAEMGICHRHELSGVLHGLFRVRAFTMDDTHIFCTPAQLEGEIDRVLNQIIFKVLAKVGFEKIRLALATRPEKSMGSDEQWERATAALRLALEASNRPFVVNEGEGAFYGPKIEVGIEDSMGRVWQCGTVQVDFCQPENFDLTYIASSGAKERVVVIHHAIYGSLDRFFGILLEHHKGHLPFWLAPVQARVLTISADQEEYGTAVLKKLFAAGMRVEIDASADALSAKIKAAQIEHVPWMIIVGGKEAAAGTVTLRKTDGTQEMGLSVETLIERAGQGSALDPKP